MESKLNTENGKVPFPALTRAQRWHLELYGYVVVENTLKSTEVSQIKNALYRLRDEQRQLDDASASGPRVRDAFIWPDVLGSDHCPVGVDID